MKKKSQQFSVVPILRPKLHFNIDFIGQVKLLLILTEIIPLKPSALFRKKSFFLEQTAEFKEAVATRVNFACMEEKYPDEKSEFTHVCLFV